MSMPIYFNSYSSALDVFLNLNNLYCTAYAIWTMPGIIGEKLSSHRLYREGYMI